MTYIEHARRKTATAMDVAYALKRQGRTLYDLAAEIRVILLTEVLASLLLFLAKFIC